MPSWSDSAKLRRAPSKNESVRPNETQPLQFRVQEAAKEATEQALEVERLARQKAVQLLTPNTRIRMEKSTNRKADQQAAEHVELLREELEEEEVLETETVVDIHNTQQSEVVVYSYQSVEPEANLHEMVPSSDAAADAGVEPTTNPVTSSLAVAAGDSIDDSLTAGMQRLYEEEAHNE